VTDQPPARDRLFALIASIPGSGSVDWSGPARALLDEIEAASGVRVPATDQTAAAVEAIRTFPFDDFGMDDVSFALKDSPETQEWVGALADAVLAGVPAAAADRAAVLWELADQQTQLAVADDLERRRDMAAARRQLVKELRRMAAAAGRVADDTQPETRPRRGDGFEAWLKARRDATTTWSAWHVIDGMLDRYRLHADTGTPLSEHPENGPAVGGAQQEEADRG